MKTSLILLLFVFFTTSAFAQWDNSKLSLTEKPLNRLNQVTEKSQITPEKIAPKEKDFTFTLNPYIWTAAVSGRVALPNTNYYDFNLKFTDAVKDLKLALMFAGRFKYKSVSLMYDMFYLKLAPPLNIPNAELSTYLSGSSEFEEFGSDITLGYRVPMKDKNVQLDVYGGVRVWSTDITMTLNATNGQTTSHNTSKTWVDPLFGALVNLDFEKNWFTYLRGDLGGFGAASEFTSSFMMGAGYRFDEHWNTTLGLKTLYVDYYKDNIRWNVWQTGLLLSAGYRF
jgi:hypothetical protein